MGSREQSLGDQPLTEGSGSQGTEALGQWGTGEGVAPFPSELPPQSDRSPTCVVWGQGEGGEQRLPLGPRTGGWQGLGIGAVLQSSVIPLALSSSCTRVR